MALPSCSSACMRAREAAVSAVSLPLKNADRHQQHDDGGEDEADFEHAGFDVHGVAARCSRLPGLATLPRQTPTSLPEPAQPDCAVLIARLPVSGLSRRRSRRERNSSTVCAGTSRVMKASPMPRARISVSLPSRTFLSCPMIAQQRGGVGRLVAGDIGDAGRQAEGGEVRLDAGHAVVADERQLLGQPERQADADGDGLAVQQPVGEAGPGLQRVAEGVAEVEQHALARLGLVAGDDAGLAAHGHARWRASAPPRPWRTRPARSAPARRNSRRRRAGRTWRPRRSRRGTAAAAAWRARRCRPAPGAADGRCRPGSCPAAC